MKYLDEDIILTFSNLPVTTSDGSFSYTLYRNGVAVFVGSVFKMTSETTLRLNVTQILQSLRFDNSTLRLPLLAVNSSVADGIVDSVYSTIDLGTVYTSNTEQVAMVYRYPHHTNSLVQTNFLPRSYQYIDIHNLQQGVNASGRQTVLMPRPPFIATDEMGFGAVYQSLNTPATEKKLFGTGMLVCEVMLDASNGCNEIFDTLDSFMVSPTSYIIKSGEDVLFGNKAALTSGNVANGTGVWHDTKTAEFKATTQNPVVVKVRSSYGTQLQVSSDLSLLKDGEHDITVTLKGNHQFHDILIGTPDDNIIIESIQSNLSLLHDDVSRKFDLYFHLLKDGDAYYIDSLDVVLKVGEEAGLAIGWSPICQFDTSCMADYYVEWVDRYGSFQCQPFSGKVVFKEDLTKQEVMNYMGYRRLSHAAVTPKFEVNTGFLKDGIVPLYESIYTSPWVLLYDTKNNKSYNVICTDKAFEEKKYRNGKQFVNLTFNFEVIKDQNIIY